MATATRPNGKGSKADALQVEPAEDIATPQVHLRRLERAVAEIPIEGITPLIMHNWSEKSKRMMLEGQQTKTRRKREPKDPEAECRAAFYRLDDERPGMPATAFKAAIADGARYFDGITIEMLKRAIRVHGIGDQQLVPIEGPWTMREDTPRNATGVADLRYRPQFWPWSALLVVEFRPELLDTDSVYNLVDAAGSSGVGDWRPSSPKSKSGTYGQWQVKE